LSGDGNTNNAYLWNWENAICISAQTMHTNADDASGNVGIGTTAPSRKLDINTTAASDYGLSHANGTIRMSSYIGTLAGVAWSAMVLTNHPFYIMWLIRGRKSYVYASGE